MFYSSIPANINTYTIDVQNKVFCQPANKKTILESDRCLANNSNQYDFIVQMHEAQFCIPGQITLPLSSNPHAITKTCENAVWTSIPTVHPKKIISECYK